MFYLSFKPEGFGADPTLFLLSSHDFVGPGWEEYPEFICGSDMKVYMHWEAADLHGVTAGSDGHVVVDAENSVNVMLQWFEKHSRIFFACLL